MRTRFEGRVVVVTGAARGIGRATALRFAREGASLVLGDRDADGLAETARQVGALGTRAIERPADVGDPAHTAGLMDAALGEMDRLDVLVNAAGRFGMGDFMHVGTEEWDGLHAVNLRGLFFCMQAAARAMAPRSQGRIVNVASIAGKRGGAWTAAYNATKAGIISVTRSAALALAPHGITVNAVCPGYVDTPMSEEADAAGVALGLASPGERRQRALAEVPLGRAATVEDVEGAITFLASDDASYITGEALNVNGGWLMD